MNGAAGSVSHAVLFDKNKTDSQNDDQYYFKNSYGPNEPYLTITKNRGTFQHFDLLRRYASNTNSASMPQFMQNSAPVNTTIDLTKTASPCWTVAELFLLSIERK